MIAVQRWGAEEGLGDELICNEGKDVRSTSNFRPVPHGYSMIYWRQGMGVVYDGGHLLVESYAEKVSSIFKNCLIFPIIKIYFLQTRKLPLNPYFNSFAFAKSDAYANIKFSLQERNGHTGALEDIEGVMVTVWSAEKDFSVLGFVTDQVNSLISEWYPGTNKVVCFTGPLLILIFITEKVFVSCLNKVSNLI